MINAAIPNIHALATVFMTGLIWTMQVVHYPLFAAVGPDQFPAYESRHMARISWLVGPGMLIEALSAAALCLDLVPTTNRPAAMVGAGLLVVVWLSTALVQGPLHARLARGYDARLVSLLVRSNWVRTIAWSIRAPLALLLLAPAPLAA